MKGDKLWKYEPVKRVPYSELPEAGVGTIFAAAITGALEEHSEDVSFSFVATRACGNCGRVRRLGDLDDDGWCWEGKC